MNNRPLVLISWDGIGPPMNCIHCDAEPNFDIIVFDYSGTVSDLKSQKFRHFKPKLFSTKTECKGDIYNILSDHLSDIPKTDLPRFVGLIDDDILMSISDINSLIHIADVFELDVFSASLRHDSIFSHRTMLRQVNQTWHRELWVEVMMPFYKTDLFMAAANHFKGNITSWGFDRYLFPTIQKLSHRNKTGIIDAVAASHIRPITSSEKIYRNGLTAKEESLIIKNRCISLISDQKPDLIKTEWFKDIFLRRHLRSRKSRIFTGIGRRVRLWLEKCT